MIDAYQSEDYGEQIIDHLPGKKIDVLIITHQHKDHFVGINHLLDNGIAVSEIWESPYDRQYGDTSVEYKDWQAYQNLVGKLVGKGTKRYSPYRSGSVYDTVGGWSFYILNPPKTLNQITTRELHDGCLVVMIESGGTRNIFCGDASDWALEQVRAEYTVSNTHVLHASHHGSIEGANLEFIKEVNPIYTIVSTKSGVHSNVPSDTALRRYRDYTKMQVYRTDTDGTQVFKHK